MDEGGSRIHNDDAQRARLTLLLISAAVLAASSCANRPTGSSADVIRTDGMDVTVTIIHQAIATPDVRLDALPANFVPGVSADKALSLALAQITWRPQHAHLYLGTRADQELAWVAVFTDAPCNMSFGVGSLLSSPQSSPSPPASPPSCSFGVVLDANSGAFVVEG